MSETGSGKRGGFDTSRPLASFIAVVGGVLVRPARFFAGLAGSETKRVKEPLIFAVICAMLSSFFSFLAAPFDPFAPESPASISGFISIHRENPGAMVALAALFILLLPVFAIVGLYIGAAIQHLFVLVFVRRRRGFQSTFLVVAYGGSVISLLTWVPIAGYLAVLYGVYVTAMGLKELHGTTIARASLAALVPAVLGLITTAIVLISSLSGG